LAHSFSGFRLTLVGPSVSGSEASLEYEAEVIAVFMTAEKQQGEKEELGSQYPLNGHALHDQLLSTRAQFLQSLPPGNNARE
jgi:hypothetical protein